MNAKDLHSWGSRVKGRCGYRSVDSNSSFSSVHFFARSFPNWACHPSCIAIGVHAMLFIRFTSISCNKNGSNLFKIRTADACTQFVTKFRTRTLRHNLKNYIFQFISAVDWSKLSSKPNTGSGPQLGKRPVLSQSKISNRTCN